MPKAKRKSTSNNSRKPLTKTHHTIATSAAEAKRGKRPLRHTLQQAAKDIHDGPARDERPAAAEGNNRIGASSSIIDTTGNRSNGQRIWNNLRARPPIRIGVPFEVTVSVVVGGNRLAILTALAHGPMSVGQIASALGALRLSQVSQELHLLQEHGLVTWTCEKTSHIYRLTHRLHVRVKDGMVQLVVVSDAGHWALLHVDEGTGSGRLVNAPTEFVDDVPPDARKVATAATRRTSARLADVVGSHDPHAHLNPDESGTGLKRTEIVTRSRMR